MDDGEGHYEGDSFEGHEERITEAPAVDPAIVLPLHDPTRRPFALRDAPVRVPHRHYVAIDLYGALPVAWRLRGIVRRIIAWNGNTAI